MGKIYVKGDLQSIRLWSNNDIYIYKMYGIYYIFNIYKKIKMRCIKI